MEIRLASDLTYDSIVDGPGLRAVIWTQGCIHNCYKCHNPQTHNLNGGIISNTDYIIKEIKKLKLQRGITISGGEPFLQARALSLVAQKAKEYDLDVWCYTGFTFETLINRYNPSYIDNINFLKYIDVLVDGKFVFEERSIDLKFRGSRNQRIIDVEQSLNDDKIILKEEYIRSGLSFAK